MNYYEKKRQLLSNIEHNLKKHQVLMKSELVYFALKNYGFSEKIVDQHLDLLYKNGKIEINEDVIEWRDTKLNAGK